MNPEDVRDLIENHVAAVLARLRADSQLATRVYEGDITGDPDWYVSLHHDTGVYSSHTQNGYSERRWR